MKRAAETALPRNEEEARTAKSDRKPYAFSVSASPDLRFSGSASDL